MFAQGVMRPGRERRLALGSRAGLQRATWRVSPPRRSVLSRADHVICGISDRPCYLLWRSRGDGRHPQTLAASLGIPGPLALPCPHCHLGPHLLHDLAFLHVIVCELLPWR